MVRLGAISISMAAGQAPPHLFDGFPATPPRTPPIPDPGDLRASSSSSSLPRPARLAGGAGVPAGVATAAVGQAPRRSLGAAAGPSGGGASGPRAAVPAASAAGHPGLAARAGPEQRRRAPSASGRGDVPVAAAAVRAQVAAMVGKRDGSATGAALGAAKGKSVAAVRPRPSRPLSSRPAAVGAGRRSSTPLPAEGGDECPRRTPPSLTRVVPPKDGQPHLGLLNLGNRSETTDELVTLVSGRHRTSDPATVSVDTSPTVARRPTCSGGVEGIAAEMSAAFSDDATASFGGSGSIPSHSTLLLPSEDAPLPAAARGSKVALADMRVPAATATSILETHLPSSVSCEADEDILRAAGLLRQKASRLGRCIREWVEGLQSGSSAPSSPGALPPPPVEAASTLRLEAESLERRLRDGGDWDPHGVAASAVAEASAAAVAAAAASEGARRIFEELDSLRRVTAKDYGDVERPAAACEMVVTPPYRRGANAVTPSVEPSSLLRGKEILDTQPQPPRNAEAVAGVCAAVAAAVAATSACAVVSGFALPPGADAGAGSCEGPGGRSRDEEMKWLERERRRLQDDARRLEIEKGKLELARRWEEELQRWQVTHKLATIAAPKASPPDFPSAGATVPMAPLQAAAAAAPRQVVPCCTGMRFEPVSGAPSPVVSAPQTRALSPPGRAVWTAVVPQVGRVTPSSIPQSLRAGQPESCALPGRGGMPVVTALTSPSPGGVPVPRCASPVLVRGGRSPSPVRVVPVRKIIGGPVRSVSPVRRLCADVPQMPQRQSMQGQLQQQQQTPAQQLQKTRPQQQQGPLRNMSSFGLGQRPPSPPRQLVLPQPWVVPSTVAAHMEIGLSSPGQRGMCSPTSPSQATAKCRQPPPPYTPPYTLVEGSAFAAL